MITLDDLRTFVAVAREGTFVGASRRTRIPTSTVSRSIARIEQQLGVLLFHRTSRRVSLSAEGVRLLARVAPLVDGLVEVATEAQELAAEPVGRLRVSAPVVSGSGWIGKSLASFAEMFPRVQVELHLTNAVVDLVAGGYDLAFRAGPIEDRAVVARRVWSSAYVLAASPAFVDRELAGRRIVRRDELERLPAIVHRPAARWIFEDGDARTTVRPNERFCADDPRVAREAAHRALGMVRLPEDLFEPSLIALGTEVGTLLTRPMFAVRPGGGRAPRRVRLAIDWVARHAPGAKL